MVNDNELFTKNQIQPFVQLDVNLNQAYFACTVGKCAVGEEFLCFSSWISFVISRNSGDRGGTVVKVLCYKSEGRWFDSRWCHWNFSLK